jgi:two-component system nitrogen regulation response regulator NtrX
MNYFLEQFAAQTGQTQKTLSKEAKSILESYPWPGNVRQLKNVMEWLTIMTPPKEEQATLKTDDLPPEILGPKVKSVNKTTTIDYTSKPLREAREAFEREYLFQQIKRFNGNVSQTAEFIGMERSALHRKLKSLDISLNDTQDKEEEGNQSALKTA